MFRLLEATPTERAAKLTYLLVMGRKFTAHEAAEVVGVGPRGARYMLEKIALQVPIYRDESGRYQLLDDSPASISPY